MFAARFDPDAWQQEYTDPAVESDASEIEHSESETDTNNNKKKRKLSSDSASDTSSSSSSSSSEEEEEDEESEDDDNNIEETAAVPSEDVDSMDVDVDQPVPSSPGKHTTVFKRFQKTIQRQAKTSQTDSEDEQLDVELNDFVPLPQPELPKDKRLTSLSSLNANLDWLAEPIYYQTDLTQPFTDFEPKIDQRIINNLHKHFGFNDAFSVQVSVIQTLLQDIEKNKLSPRFQNDLLVNASTGSGKTLAYCIPVVQALMHRVVPRLRCIILVPTKPLIQQVRQTLAELLKGINLNIMTFKNDTSIKDEAKRYHAMKPDIVISTPGRLVEHLDILDLTSLRYLIIDEADRLLNQSFQNWCDLLIGKLSTEQVHDPINKWSLKCSKLIFSATLTTNSEKLSHLQLESPRLIIVNDAQELVNELYQLPPRLKECYVRLNSGLSQFKPLVLFKFLQSYKGRDERNDQFVFNKNILIFTKSNESSSRLHRLLVLLAERFNLPMKIASVSSSLKNQERQKLIKQFAANEVDVLISTDLMSRGIDLINVKTVLNYDLPLSTREYIHRIGRTARANKFGYGITFIFGLGEWKYMSKQCLFNSIVSRKDKTVHKINVSRKHSDGQADGDEMQDKEPRFELELEEYEKKIYEDCLKELEKEVYQKD